MCVRLLAVLGLLLFSSAAMGAASAPKPLSFGVFAKTGLPLGESRGPGALPLRGRADRGDSGERAGGDRSRAVREPAGGVRGDALRPSPGDHGWAAADVYCHAPHGGIWRVGVDGSTTAFATLPDARLQDGAIAFDTAGGFGYALLAASGGSASQGGTVFAVGPAGGVAGVGAYPGPGGADNVELAPARFGSASSQLLIAIDSRSKGGRVLAMAPGGAVRTLVTVSRGINPIVVIGRGDAPRGAAKPGLYLTDTLSKNAYFAPAAQLAPIRARSSSAARRAERCSGSSVRRGRGSASCASTATSSACPRNGTSRAPPMSRRAGAPPRSGVVEACAASG